VLCRAPRGLKLLKIREKLAVSDFVWRCETSYMVLQVDNANNLAPILRETLQPCGAFCLASMGLTNSPAAVEEPMLPVPAERFLTEPVHAR
jgi:hypothetical protein